MGKDGESILGECNGPEVRENIVHRRNPRKAAVHRSIKKRDQGLVSAFQTMESLLVHFTDSCSLVCGSLKT